MPEATRGACQSQSPPVQRFLPWVRIGFTGLVVVAL